MPTSSVCAAMTQLYLCEEPYWSKYDRSEICPHALQINVISDGKEGQTKRRGVERGTKVKLVCEERLAEDFFYHNKGRLHALDVFGNSGRCLFMFPIPRTGTTRVRQIIGFASRPTD